MNLRSVIHPLALGTAVFTLVALAAAGRAEAADPRLAARLDPETAAAVGALVDSAQAIGLPTDPLVARALEGASRGASGARITAAVSNLAAGMEAMREVLGERSTAAELVAGAAALSAGVPAESLASLRLSRESGSLLVPLVVLADLVARRVPVETASAAVLAAARARVRDPDLMRLRERIDRDIRSGATPGHATILRTRHLIGTFEGPAQAPQAPRSPRGAGP